MPRTQLQSKAFSWKPRFQTTSRSQTDISVWSTSMMVNNVKNCVPVWRFFASFVVALEQREKNPRTL